MLGVIYKINAAVQCSVFCLFSPTGVSRWQIESQWEYHADPETGDNTEGLCQAVRLQTIQCLREMQMQAA